MSLPEKCQQCGRLAFGDEMVTITAAEYSALLARPGIERLVMGKPSRSPIVRDRELADFIIDCATPGTMIVREIRDACVARFGVKRTPSRAALHRFIQQVARHGRPHPVERRA